jgi:hypothetical protein
MSNDAPARWIAWRLGIILANFNLIISAGEPQLEHTLSEFTNIEFLIDEFEVIGNKQFVFA